MFEETKLRDDLILMVFLLSARAARVRVRVCVCVCVCVCCIRYFSSLLYCVRDIVISCCDLLYRCTQDSTLTFSIALSRRKFYI